VPEVVFEVEPKVEAAAGELEAPKNVLAGDEVDEDAPEAALVGVLGGVGLLDAEVVDEVVAAALVIEAAEARRFNDGFRDKEEDEEEEEGRNEDAILPAGKRSCIPPWSSVIVVVTMHSSSKWKSTDSSATP
jgi:hypothetical protein